MFVSLPTDYSHCSLGSILENFYTLAMKRELYLETARCHFSKITSCLKLSRTHKRNKIVQSPDTELHASEFTTQSLDDIHSILW